MIGKQTYLTAEQIRNLNPKKLRQFILEGKNREQIAKICGVSKWTISDRMREYKIRRGDLFTKRIDKG